MITVKDLTDREFTHQRIINHDPFTTHVYMNGSVTVEMDYMDNELVGMDVILPSFTIRNFTADRLDLLMSVLSPDDGEMITIFD